MEEEVKEYKYEAPSKKIRVPEMVRVWEESEAFQEYLGQKILHFSSVLLIRIRDG
jgi:hypothetical protein